VTVLPPLEVTLLPPLEVTVLLPLEVTVLPPLEMTLLLQPVPADVIHLPLQHPSSPAISVLHV